MQIISATTALKKIDWDFTGVKTNHSTHSLHPYPAKYIPQIPAALIKELSNLGETVVDIFCGSGTTLVEALSLGRNAIGIDANPLACLISEAKTTKLTQNGQPPEPYSVTRRLFRYSPTVKNAK